MFAISFLARRGPTRTYLLKDYAFPSLQLLFSTSSPGSAPSSQERSLAILNENLTSTLRTSQLTSLDKEQRRFFATTKPTEASPSSSAPPTEHKEPSAFDLAQQEASASEQEHESLFSSESHRTYLDESTGGNIQNSQVKREQSFRDLAKHSQAKSSQFTTSGDWYEKRAQEGSAIAEDRLKQGKMNAMIVDEGTINNDEPIQEGSAVASRQTIYKKIFNEEPETLLKDAKQEKTAEKKQSNKRSVKNNYPGLKSTVDRSEGKIPK